MNRNTEMHFSNTPQINLRRSKFDESHSHKTTFNTGDCIPIFTDMDILPGDTVQMDIAELVRMATPIYPIMDNLYCDVMFFFVPHRLVWDHWPAFWGENDNPWIQETEYETPQITAPAGGWTEGTIADYMGIPTKVPNKSVSAFGFRAYAKIWNDWFRDENLKKNCHIYMDETTRQGTNGTGDYVLDVELGGKPAKAAKYADIFTKALPSPQRGPAVTIPMSEMAPLTGTAYITYGNDYAKVGGRGTNTQITSLPGSIRDTPIVSLYNPPATLASGRYALNFFNATANAGYGDLQYNTSQAGTTENSDLLFTNLATQNFADMNTTTEPDGTRRSKSYANLKSGFADLSAATATTINALRTAFAIQKYYENAGLHGTRYIEYIRGVFGVTSSDARLQRSEYLGGHRFPLNVDQVIQTSSTDATTPQGNAAGFSCTVNQGNMFTKSFEEHGTLMAIAVVRTEHTYQQGLHKQWTRKKWVHYYNPFFANLGESALLNENIYAQGTDEDEEAFGYQEAWAEYRYKENRCSGYMRSNANGSLDAWHFADDYDSLPILGTTWIDEPVENVDRTIAVTSQRAHQFTADFFFKCFYTRPMPVYSIPGLIDHV